MYREYPKFKPEEIIVYLRRSRSDDPSMTTEEVFAMHKTKLDAWIERNLDEPIPKENWFEEVVSGETIMDRKEFQKILKLIELPKYSAVLCVECVRLSRGDMEDCGRIMKLFRFTSTYIITPERMFDLRDEFDREGFEREIKHGNYYLEYSKKLMKRGKDYAASQGAYVGAVAPYGYKLTRVAVGKKKLPTLEIVEEDAKVVRMIFDWYVNEGVGAQMIANRLDEMSIKPLRADTWRLASIRKILCNEHYIGKITANVHKMDHVVKDQEVIKKRIRTECYNVFDGLHEPIIDEKTFYLAMKKKDKNPKVHYGKVIRNPLASILYCECGHAMIFCYKKGVPRFECTEQRKCRNASIDGKYLLDEVAKALKNSIEDFSVALDESNDDMIVRHKEKITFLEKRIKDIEYKELSLWQKYTEEGMPKAVFDSLRIKYETEKSDVEKSLNEAMESMPERIDYTETTLKFHEALEALNNPDASGEKKNKLLKACIKKIVYKRKGSVRGAKEDVKEGQKYDRGWISFEPELDFMLKV